MQLTAQTPVAPDMDFVLKGPVSAVRAGGGLRVIQWTTRLGNVYLIAQVMAISIWKPKNASVKDNGLEMTALKVPNFSFFSFSYRISRFSKIF